MAKQVNVKADKIRRTRRKKPLTPINRRHKKRIGPKQR